MSTHTPGPWKWFDYPDGRKLLASRSRAVIHCPEAWMECEPADERLIAAAPDLLDAARYLVDVAVNDADACPLCGRDASAHDPDCAVTLAKAAIARAEGKGQAA